MADRPTVLLTGFGPFPGVPVNATTLLMPRIARAVRRRRPSLTIRTAILPTEWRRGPDRAATAVGRWRPDLVVHFGVSALATGFVIERQGTSTCRPLADAVGLLPPAQTPPAQNPPAQNRAGSRPVSLPPELLIARLHAEGWPADVSDDAGGYLCNAVLYRTLTLPDDIAPRAAGFIHLPAGLAGSGPHGRDSDPALALSQAQAVAGGVAIVLAGLDFLAPALAPDLAPERDELGDLAPARALTRAAPNRA